MMDQIPNNFMESCSCYLRNRMFNITNTNFMVEIDMGTWRRKLISCLAVYLHSRCPLKRVTNYTLLENKMLIVGNDLCSSSQCMSMNNGFVICISMLERKDFFVPSYEWSDHSQKTWEYIWIFGIMISFICYFIIIIVYQFIIDEKSLTSTIIVFQCVTLLFTDASFVVALRIRHHTFSCKFIGIALHWGILASQIWTAIIAFDLSSKLRSISATIIKTNSVRLAGYDITAYVTPAIIVSTCTFFQTHHLIDRGYEANGFCFISDCRLVIYFFVIPLAIIFLITTFIYMYSLYCIWKKEKKARTTLRTSARHNNNLLSIAFKLTVALSLIEVFGFIQICKDNISESELIFTFVFRIIYAFLRSLRGLWLLLIFVCNGSKLKLLRSTWTNSQ